MFQVAASTQLHTDLRCGHTHLYTYAKRYARTQCKKRFFLVILNCNLKYGSLVFGVPKCTCILNVLEIYAHEYERTLSHTHLHCLDYEFAFRVVSFVLFSSMAILYDVRFGQIGSSNLCHWYALNEARVCVLV